ncbi:tetratricopeptide repeat protein [candidate division KSB1 bacterium]|nr:tetratricopeptide repeat protein [candidate division KSB1 bacterium]
MILHNGWLKFWFLILLNILIIQHIKGSEKKFIFIFDYQGSSIDSAQAELNHHIPNLLENHLLKNKNFIVQRVQAEDWKNFDFSSDTIKSNPLAILGSWREEGQFIKIFTRLIALETGGDVLKYENSIAVNEFKSNINFAIPELAETISRDLEIKSTPLGYPFSINDFGILLYDFSPVQSTPLKNSLSSFRHLLRDSLDNFKNNYQLENLNLQRPEPGLLTRIYPVMQPTGVFNVTQSVGQKLNAKLILALYLKPNAKNVTDFPVYFQVLDTLLLIPELEFDGQISLLPAENLFQISWAKNSWQKSELIWNYLKANLLLQYKKYEAADKEFAALKKQSTNLTPEFSKIAINFYLATSRLLTIQPSENLQNDKPAKFWKELSSLYRKALLNSEKLKDHSTSISILNNLGVLKQMQGKSDSALVCFQTARKKPSVHISKIALLRINHNLMAIWQMRKNWENVMALLNENASLLTDSTDQRNLAIIEDYLGYFSENIGNLPAAIEHFRTAIKIKQHLKEQLLLASSYSFLSRLYQSQAAVDSALNYAYLELEIRQNDKVDAQLAQIYERIGNLQRLKGNQNLALENYYKQLEFLQSPGNEQTMIQVHLKIAEIQQGKGNSAASIESLEKARLLAKKERNPALIARILDRMGDIYDSRSQFDAALNAYQQARELFEITNQIERQALATFNIGMIQVKKRNYRQGYEMMQQAMAIEKTAGFSNLSKYNELIEKVREMIR